MKLRLTLYIALSFVVVTAPAFAKEPYCKPCPLSCEDLEFGRKDCANLKSRDGVCCVQLSKDALKLVQAQDAALETQKPQETCPSGFKPSEQKCSNAERKNGCKDIRLPSGLGCVKR